MEVRVEKTENPQMYLIVFEGKDAAFPTSPITFQDKEDARLKGFYAVNDILTNPKVSSVQAGQFDSIDMFAVTLKDGETWGDPASSSSEASIVKKYIDRFLTDKEAIYQDPKEARMPTKDEVQRFTEERSRDATSPFYTVTNHHGGLEVDIDPNTRTILVTLFGACASNCLKGSTLHTKRSIAREFKQLQPGLRTLFLN